MSIRSVLPNTQDSRARAPSSKPMDKTAKAAHTRFSQNSSPPSGDLKTKRVTWKSPLVAFLNLIMSFLSFLTGSNSSSPTPQSKTPISASTTEAAVPEKADLKVVVSTNQLPPTTEPRPKKPEMNSDKLKQQEQQRKIKDPATALLKLLKQHFTDQVAARIFAQIHLSYIQRVEAAISAPEEDLNTKITHTANELINNAVLSDLRPQLEKKVIEILGEAEGKKLTSLIFSDSEFIGKDISCNRAILTKEKRDEIVKKAKVVLEHYPQFCQGLEDVKKELAKGFPPDRTTLFKKYPDFEKALAYMPAGKKEEFERLLSETWARNKMKRVTEFRRSSTEEIVLKGLGYKVSAEGEQFLKESMIFMLEGYLKEPKLPPVEQLKAKFKKWAFEARLRDAGVEPEDVEKVQKIIHTYRQRFETLMTEADKEVKKLALASNLPEAQDYLQNLLFEHHCASIENYLQQVLTSQPADLVKLQASFTQIPEKVKKGIDWFNKHGALMHTEFAQGKSGSSEVLGSGICAGLCLRFVQQSLQSPTSSTDQIVIRTIQNIDRKNQAFHCQGHESRNGILLFPPEFLEKLSLKEKQRLRILTEGKDGDFNVLSGLKEILEQTAKSKINPHFILAWGRHATALCFDPQNNRFLFFDPNFGTLEFKKGPQETLESLAQRMATAYVELYRWAYGERTNMRLQQISPLLPFSRN